ncbi:MAG: hypothetical protein KF716_08850 [Anaerolineae bacterium]|nr:hypothetical protein [Anaerolineae bacterium]
MSRFYAAGEKIAVETDEAQHPMSYIWQLQHYDVENIADHWRIDEDWWQQRLWRDYFKLTTTSGYLVLIYHDLVADNWYLQRVYD